MYLTDELKDIFWNQVLPSIVNYQLLSNDIKEYYSLENIFLEVDEKFINTLKNNEPKGSGKDYILWRSPEKSDEDVGTESDAEEDETIHRELTTKLTKTLETQKNYTNHFGSDTDSDTDENCLKIKDKKQEVTEELDNAMEILFSTFNLIVRTKEEAEANEKLSKQEIMSRLSDPNVMSTIEHVINLPRGLKSCMTEIDFFKDQMRETFESPEDNEQENIPPNSQESGSLEVPSYEEQSSSLQETPRPLGDSSNVSQLLTSSSSPNKSQSQLITPRITRSRKLVQERTSNKRMQGFVEQFQQPKPSKRPRDSTSPL